MTPLQIASEVGFLPGMEALVLWECTAEHFQMLEFLKCGGFGAVYRAKCIHPNHPYPDRKHYAVKVLYDGSSKSSSLDRYQLEFNHYGHLGQHPRLVKFWRSFKGTVSAGIRSLIPSDRTALTGGESKMLHLFAVFDYCPLSLARAIEERPSNILSTREFYGCGRQLFDAWQWMDSRGFLHRDIKPDNILVKANGALCLCDLGLAVRLVSTPLVCALVLQLLSCVMLLWSIPGPH